MHHPTDHSPRLSYGFPSSAAPSCHRQDSSILDPALALLWGTLEKDGRTGRA